MSLVHVRGVSLGHVSIREFVVKHKLEKWNLFGHFFELHVASGSKTVHNLQKGSGFSSNNKAYVLEQRSSRFCTSDEEDVRLFQFELADFALSFRGKHTRELGTQHSDVLRWLSGSVRGVIHLPLVEVVDVSKGRENNLTVRILVEQNLDNAIYRVS